MFFLMLPATPTRSWLNQYWMSSADDASFVGVWKGESVCQVRESACHDEASVYYVSKGADADTFQIKGNKVVDGKEVFMGALTCKAGSAAGSYICRPDDGSVWSWRLNKDVLDGELQVRGQLFRKIHLTRAK
jgi:uncharacterized protein (DUF2147 family)